LVRRVKRVLGKRKLRNVDGPRGALLRMGLRVRAVGERRRGVARSEFSLLFLPDVSLPPIFDEKNA
jgi:hypothetical protein